MKRALLMLMIAVPASAAKKPVTLIQELSGGTLQADGKYLVKGDKLPSGKTATLQRGATLVLDSGRAKLLIKGPAVFSTTQDDVDLQTGGVLAHVEQGRRYSVRTPAAALAVRGTTFFAETRGSYETYLCLCDGILEVTSDKLGYRTAVTSQHEHTPRLFKMSGASGEQKKAEMSGHTDAEIEALGRPSKKS